MEPSNELNELLKQLLQCALPVTRIESRGDCLHLWWNATDEEFDTWLNTPPNARQLMIRVFLLGYESAAFNFPSGNEPPIVSGKQFWLPREATGRARGRFARKY
jgi:acid stress-induced BolA-like protein IbaG/YrbA